MERPRWEHREAWALAEAKRSLDRGLPTPPVLLLFEGDEATVYVRGGAKAGPVDGRLAWNELFALGWTLRPEGALLLTSVRLRTDEDGAPLGEAEGQAGIGVQWTRRRDHRPPERGGTLVTYGLDDDGAPLWRDRTELPSADGPMSAALTAVVTGRWPATRSGDDDRPAELGMSPASLAYALTRSGLTIGVADGWSERYGFDVPIRPDLVRREDRRRARERWARRRDLTEVRP